MDYEEANRRRFELARDLIQRYPFVLVPLYPYNYKVESKRGKVPCIKWGGVKSTSLRDLQDWQELFDGWCNLGLVMGVKSGGTLGIDVDGAGGHEILKEISGDDLPATVTYTTPGGDGKGLRYLYLYPEEYQGKVFQKRDRSEGNHNGVEFLVDGQQSVLPYSIHPNGGIYRFVKGHSFRNVEIAVAPSWVMDILLKPKKAVPLPGVIVSKKATPVTPTGPEAGVGSLILKSGCQRLLGLLEEQRSEQSLEEPRWFEVVSLLTMAGYPDMARDFSALSHKHDRRSGERIDALEREGPRGTTRCTTLGCSEENVARCFKNLHRNETGELTNSPAVKLRPKEEKKAERRSIVGDAGLLYDQGGNFRGLNANIFVRHFLEKVELRIQDARKAIDCRYYIYKNNYWRECTELDLKRALRELLDVYEPDQWTSALEHQCLTILPLEARKSIDLTNATNYINVRNGLLNLETLVLEPHRSDVFCTTQIPVLYDAEATCPHFLAFLDDVFTGDRELITLIQEIFGYALSPSIAAQKFFVWIGDGSNAKSVTSNLLSSLIGEENVANVSLRQFSERFGLASIVDKRLLIAAENESVPNGLSSEILKEICSGEPITVERKHENAFSYRPTMKMVFLVNRPPNFQDLSHGLRRRMLMTPFNRCYVDDPATSYEGKLDLFILDKLLGELPGILAWALNGWQRLRGNNLKFSTSRAVEEYMEELWLEFNPYLDFVRTCILPISEGKITPKELFGSVSGFMSDIGYRSSREPNTRSVCREIEAVLKREHIPFQRHRSGGWRNFEGIALNSEGQKSLSASRKY